MSIYAEVDQRFYSKDYAGALRVAEFGLASAPADPKLLRAMGKVYHQLKHFARAEDWFTALIKHNAPMFDDYLSRATVRNEQSKYPLVIEDLNRAELLNNQSIDLYLKRGGAYWEMRDYVNARRDFEQALALQPNHPDAVWINGLLDLQEGRFETGWPRYEARWRSARFKSNRLVTTKPQWSPGSGLKRVLVWGEQGIGDQIFYASMLNRLRYETDKVTMLVDPRLISLLSRSMPTIDFLPNTSEVESGDHDSHLPIASIGAQFVKSLDDIPQVASRNYIKADPERVAALRARLPAGPPLVGLSWTSAAIKIGPHKSMALETLKPVLGLPCRFVNLQYVSSITDIGDPRIMNPKINTRDDFETLAALLELCDVVVSVSSSTVHLAGALGRPVLLMDANKLWYWGNKSDDQSLWYPSVTVYPRDHMLAPWDNVVQRVKAELERRFV
jgi:tetratricopeptide (TPR) repeat protein